MNDKDKEILEYNKRFMIKVLKSALYTFFIFMLSTWGIYSIVSLIFKNMSVEQSNTWGILSFCVGIIFTIFYCTFTIIEEIRKEK